MANPQNGDMKRKDAEEEKEEVPSRSVNVARLAGSARCVTIWYIYYLRNACALRQGRLYCKFAHMLNALIPFSLCFDSGIV